jgi:hypothetical protein
MDAMVLLRAVKLTEVKVAETRNKKQHSGFMIELHVKNAKATKSLQL